jgi:eukaryotic-like serine/threonine-protein kinase
MAQNQGMASEALKYTDLALARAAKAPIPSGKFIAELTGDRGFALHMAGRNGEANRYFESARDQFRKLGLEDFNPSRSTMGNWGLVAYGSGDYKHGFEIYDHLLHIQERLAGTEPVSPGALGNYAHGLEALGRYPEALEAYNRTYDSAVQTGFVGAQGYALIGKASVLVQLGDLAGAQSNLDRATALIQGRMAESSPIQLRRAFTQSQIESAQGRVHEALASVTHLIDGLLAHNQRLNPAAVSAYRERAELEVQDRGHDAEVDAREAVKIAEALQGGNRFSGDTGGAYLTLGSVLAKAGDARGARAALETAVDHLSHALGPEHPATKRAQDLGAQLDPAVHAVQTASQ